MTTVMDDDKVNRLLRNQKREMTVAVIEYSGRADINITRSNPKFLNCHLIRTEDCPS